MLYGVLAKVYRLVPSRVRAASAVRSLRRRVQQLIATHDDLYGAAYYADHARWSAAAAKPLAELIAGEYRPKSVLDVGCAEGMLLEALRDRHDRVEGLEYSTVAVDQAGRKGLNVQQFDIESESFDGHYDVA